MPTGMDSYFLCRSGVRFVDLALGPYTLLGTPGCQVHRSPDWLHAAESVSSGIVMCCSVVLWQGCEYYRPRQIWSLAVHSFGYAWASSGPLFEEQSVSFRLRFVDSDSVVVSGSSQSGALTLVFVYRPRQILSCAVHSFGYASASSGRVRRGTSVSELSTAICRV